MKTTHPFFNIFRKKSALIILHVLFVGLIVFAVVNQITGASRNRSPMPLRYDPDQDIILNSKSITDRSSTGVRVVNDEEASIGQAIEFFSGANQRVESQPKVYVEMRFSAPAGRYTVWLRGKSNINSGYTDSVWLQLWMIRSEPAPEVSGWGIGWISTPQASMLGPAITMILSLSN
jgi:hypothetical protein